MTDQRARYVQATAIASAGVSAAGWASSLQWLRDGGLAALAGSLVVLSLKWLVSYVVNRVTLRAELINSLPEKLEEFEARAVRRDEEWKDRLVHFDRRFDQLGYQIKASDEKLDASMALEKVIIDNLVRRLEEIESRQGRLENRVFWMPGDKQIPPLDKDPRGF